MNTGVQRVGSLGRETPRKSSRAEYWTVARNFQFSNTLAHDEQAWKNTLKEDILFNNLFSEEKSFIKQWRRRRPKTNIIEKVAISGLRVVTN